MYNITMAKKTEELQQILKHASKDELNTYLKEVSNITFQQYFESLCDKYALNKSTIIQNSLLDRTYAYQIIQERRNGSKDKILLLALGLQCNLQECNKLLTLSNNSILYANRKRDALIIYAIEKHLSVIETNELLVDQKEEILQ